MDLLHGKGTKKEDRGETRGHTALARRGSTGYVNTESNSNRKLIEITENILCSISAKSVTFLSFYPLWSFGSFC